MAESEGLQQKRTGFKGFKKRKQIFVNRQKKSESSESDDDEDSAVKIVQRAGNKHKIIGSHSSGPNSSKKATQKNGSARKSDSESEDEDIEKKTKSKISVTYDSSRTGKREGPEDMGATSVLEIDTELDRDAQAIYEKQLQTNKEEMGQEDDKLYKGQSGYAKYYEKRDTAQGNAASGMVRLVFKAELHNLNPTNHHSPKNVQFMEHLAFLLF